MKEQREKIEERYPELIEEAMKVRKQSYSPYSHFMVGAALLGKDGKIYTGCNIENAAFTPSNCAERTAFFNAVSQGEKDFFAIAIVAGPQSGGKRLCPPCGVCLQVMTEFCEPKEFKIILAAGADDYRIYTLQELLPEGFGPETLKGTSSAKNAGHVEEEVDMTRKHA